jgi:cyclophilin family peptidyl-prolyl cis-trans isomerase
MANQNMILTLDGGDVTIRLRDDLAPKHTARIAELVKSGFYDGLNFHRVIDGFVAQGGCPDGNGMGGSGQKIEAEFNSEPHKRGVCSMARSSDPNSADSQFFICLDAVPYLDNQYTVWGEVTDGIEHVDALPKGEPPRSPGMIKSARIEDSA